MRAIRPRDLELSPAWYDNDQHARWRSASALGAGVGAQASGASVLEVPRGCRLPRHVDSAEEIVVVLAGEAEVEMDGETARVPAGSLVLVPEGVPHEVRNAGAGPLRFAAIYAAADVTTTYERPVEPDGARERGSTA